MCPERSLGPQVKSRPLPGTGVGITQSWEGGPSCTGDATRVPDHRRAAPRPWGSRAKAPASFGHRGNEASSRPPPGDGRDTGGPRGLLNIKRSFFLLIISSQNRRRATGRPHADAFFHFTLIEAQPTKGTIHVSYTGNLKPHCFQRGGHEKIIGSPEDLLPASREKAVLAA